MKIPIWIDRCVWAGLVVGGVFTSWGMLAYNKQVYEGEMARRPVVTQAIAVPAACEPCEALGEPEAAAQPLTRLAFLAEVIHALDKLGATPEDVAEYVRRGLKESRFNPTIESVTGDVGQAQINRKSHPKVNFERLKREPAYVADQWFPLFRKAVENCGRADWECCYNRGAKGCRDWRRHHPRKVKP